MAIILLVLLVAVILGGLAFAVHILCGVPRRAGGSPPEPVAVPR